MALDDKALDIPIFNLYKDKFTKSDISLANFIARNIDDLMAMTISDISQELKISEMTVSRFCKKIGLAGFQALKVNIASTNIKVSANALDLIETDDTKTISNKIFQNIITSLNTSLAITDYKAIDQATEILNKSERILAFGFGTSRTICQDIACRFIRFGFITDVVSDNHQQTSILSAKTNIKTTLILVSVSGCSIDLINCIKIAKENNIKVILITSYNKSPLAKLSDVVLVGYSPEIKLISEAFITRIVYLAIIDILFTKLYILRASTYDESILSMRKNLANLRT